MLLKNLVLSQVEMLPLKRHRLLQSLRRVTPGPLPLAQRLPAARGQDGGAKPGRASMGGAGWAGAGPSPHGPPPGELRLRRGGGARADRAGRWAWPRCGGGAGRWLGARRRRSPFPPRGRYAARAAAAPRSPQGRCRGAAAPAPGAQRALRRAGGRGERRRQGKRGARGDGCVQGAGGAKPKRPRAAAAGPGLGGARPPGAPGCGGARPGRPRRLRGGGGAGRPRGAAVPAPGGFPCPGRGDRLPPIPAGSCEVVTGVPSAAPASPPLTRLLPSAVTEEEQRESLRSGSEGAPGFVPAPLLWQRCRSLLSRRVFLCGQKEEKNSC